MKLPLKSHLIALALIPTSVSAMPDDRSEAPAPSKADGYALGYFLPKGRAAASYSQRIVQCPTADNPKIIVEAHAQILAKVVPDHSRLYRIDTRAGFLAKRSTDLTLNADGTIKAVNATVEGQGMAVLISTLKFATFGASLALGSPVGLLQKPAAARSPGTVCQKRVADLLDQRNRLAERIIRLDETFAAGGLTSDEADELTYQRDRLADLDDALTLSSRPQIIDPAAGEAARVGRLDYGQWFDTMDPVEIAGLPGDDGVEIRWIVNEGARGALTRAAYVKPAEVASLSAAPAPVIYYRRPVPVAISMEPCTRHVDKAEGKKLKPAACTPDVSPEAAPLYTSASASFPQLSGLFRLPIGRGGLFGSRTVGAEFDETGAPISLKYGSDPGAADIAAGIDAARETGTTLRDAKSEALARKVALLQSRKDIRDLEAELAK